MSRKWSPVVGYDILTGISDAEYRVICEDIIDAAVDAGLFPEVDTEDGLLLCSAVFDAVPYESLYESLPASFRRRMLVAYHRSGATEEHPDMRSRVLPRYLVLTAVRYLTRV